MVLEKAASVGQIGELCELLADGARVGLQRTRWPYNVRVEAVPPKPAT